MIRKILQIRNLLMALLVGECGILFGLYLLLNTPILLAFSVYALIKNVIIFLIVVYISYVLENNQLSVEEVLNKDAKNAFIFGGIALIQYDENRNIVWTSDLLKAMNINIVGVKLLEWQPHLASLFDDEDVKVIDIKGKKFEAYINQGTKLI